MVSGASLPQERTSSPKRCRAVSLEHYATAVMKLLNFGYGLASSQWVGKGRDVRRYRMLGTSRDACGPCLTAAFSDMDDRSLPAEMLGLSSALMAEIVPRCNRRCTRTEARYPEFVHVQVPTQCLNGELWGREDAARDGMGKSSKRSGGAQVDLLPVALSMIS